jgi:hypothetical protein
MRVSQPTSKSGRTAVEVEGWFMGEEWDPLIILNIVLKEGARMDLFQV